MRDDQSPNRISDADYEAIESAVMETERGRWFLKEFALRNRSADTRLLLDAINQLEQAVARDRIAQDIDRLRLNLSEMAKAIARTKTDIVAMHTIDQEHSHLYLASEALDAITRTTERATSDILAAAERIQESAWTLREQGADPGLCDDLDRRATEIYTACSFQDLTAQRIARIVQTLRYLEVRINAMIERWGGSDDAAGFPEFSPPVHLPPLSGEPDAGEWSRSDVDSIIVSDPSAIAPEGESCGRPLGDDAEALRRAAALMAAPSDSPRSSGGRI